MKFRFRYRGISSQNLSFGERSVWEKIAEFSVYTETVFEYRKSFTKKTPKKYTIHSDLEIFAIHAIIVWRFELY